jgi:hypothetical protein
MFKNLKIKFIGLLIIAMFMISAVPACSAEEAQKSMSTELLVTKTLPELVNVMNINNSQKKELNDVLNDPHLLYSHTVQKLGCNLTAVNFAKLTEFLQNTSNSEADWVFYNQWINDTQQVVTYKSMTDTVENIYMSNPLLQATVQGFEDSYVKYNQMSEYDQWRFIQTKSITDEDLNNAYANATPGQLQFMLDQSLPELEDTKKLCGQSTSYLIDHVSELSETTQRDIKNFNDKTMWAYESYKGDINDTEPTNDSLDSLLDVRDSVNENAGKFLGIVTGVGVLGGGLFIMSLVVLALGDPILFVILFFASACLGLSEVIFVCQYQNYRQQVRTLSDKIHTLYPNYDDSWFEAL